MSKLVLHDLTARQVEQFIDRPVHAVLLSGAMGSGKSALARSIAGRLLVQDESGLDRYQYAFTLAAEPGKTIGIEAIRELEHFLRLKVPAPKSVNRVVIVENSHAMTIEAQNALLKTLEEPPEHTVLILTTASEQAMLPTIRSRTRHISVQPPGKDALLRHFKEQGHQEADVVRCYSISGGLPGLMQALLTEADHPLKAATEKARQLLAQTAYERLITVDELAKQRQLAADTLFILQQMARLSLQTAKGPAARRWQRILEISYQTDEALSNSAQPKLALTNLALNL